VSCSRQKAKEELGNSQPHPDLAAALKLAYEPSGLILKNLTQKTESKEYGAFLFELNQRRICFRVGKITPTKVGQFVTLWKRMGNGAIQPHDVADPIDFFVVSVRNSEQFGQFVFPKAVLLERDIISQDGQRGKLAMRVYPPWDMTKSRQAKRTQDWQRLYFFKISLNSSIDTNRVQKLFQA
jgi:hypothetical protein